MRFIPAFSVPLSRLVALGSLLCAPPAQLAAQTATFVNARSSLGTGFSQPTGLAVDSAGDLFVVDNTGNKVVEIAAATGVQTTIGSGLKNPTGVALNSAGDVFIADSGNNRVVVVPAGGGPQLTVGASSLNTPIQVALDSAGNLYIVDNGNAQVLKIWANGGAPTAIATGLADPQGVAVDSAGNVYISQNSAETVIELPAAGGSPKTVSTGFIPTQLATDAAGDLFIAGDGGVMELPAGGNSTVNAASGLTGYTQGVAVDSAGRLFVSTGGAPIITEVQNGAVDFGGLPVCHIQPDQRTPPGCTLALALYFLTETPENVYPYPVSTRGLGSGDFLYGDPSGTCGTNVGDLDYCYVVLSFAPTSPGLRRSAVLIGDQQGHILANVPIYGTGLAPQTAFDGGGNLSTVGSGFNKPSAMVLDGAGDLFVTDTFNNRVVEIPANGGAQTTPGPGLNLPAGIAIDGAGNLYVSELGADNLDTIPISGSGVQVADTGFSGPAGVAVDALGNVYVANSGGSQVSEVVAGTGKIVTLGSGLKGPSAVALDAAGDLFIADSANNRVVELPAGGGAQTVVATGLKDPEGIAVDAAGDLFVSDTGNNIVVEIPAGSNAQLPIGTGFKSPLGLLLDDAGDLYVADSGNNRVIKVTRSVAPPLHFAPTVVGQTGSDRAESVTAQNEGNQPLTLGQVSYPVDFPIDFNAGDDLCTGSAVLAPGQKCLLPVSFTPLHSGALSEELTITDNSLNVTGTVHSVALSGTGLVAQSIVFLPPAGVTFGAAPIDLSKLAAATSGLPLSFTVVSGPATTKGSVVTFTGAGSVVIEAMQAGNSSYVAAAPVEKTIAVAKATPAITWPTPAPIIYGKKLGAGQLDAKSPVAGKFVYSPASGTALAVGSHKLLVTFTPTSTANYLTAKASVTITVTKATLTVTAKSFSIKHGSAIPKLTAIYTGFVNADTAKALTGAPVLSTTAKSTSPVGAYTIAIKQGTLAAKNYAFKFANGKLTITAASIVKKPRGVTLPLPPPSPPRASSPSPL